MNIYLVRHGESKGNKVSTHQTEKTPLSADGLKQAKIVAERLKSIHIDVIYASPYKRTSQTANIISKKLKKPIEYWGELHEIRNPSEISELFYEHPESVRIRKLIEDNFALGNWKYSDEETYNDLKDRASKVLKHLLDKHKDQNVLCISHGTIIKMIIACAIFGENLTPEIFWNFRRHTWQENTGITRLEFTDKYGWGLMTWNDTAHL